MRANKVQCMRGVRHEEPCACVRGAARRCWVRACGRVGVGVRVGVREGKFRDGVRLGIGSGLGGQLISRTVWNFWRKVPKPLPCVWMFFVVLSGGGDRGG